MPGFSHEYCLQKRLEPERNFSPEHHSLATHRTHSTAKKVIIPEGVGNSHRHSHSRHPHPTKHTTAEGRLVRLKKQFTCHLEFKMGKILSPNESNPNGSDRCLLARECCLWCIPPPIISSIISKIELDPKKLLKISLGSVK